MRAGNTAIQCDRGTGADQPCRSFPIGHLNRGFGGLQRENYGAAWVQFTRVCICAHGSTPSSTGYRWRHSEASHQRSEQTLRDLYAERVPLYERYGEVIIDCDDETPESIADTLAKHPICRFTSGR